MKYKSKTNSFEEVPCIIALDQSYTRTGISICVNGIVKKCYSVDLKNIKYRTTKRMLVKKYLEKALDSCLKHYESSQIVVIVERIRTFTGTDSLRPEIIKSLASLVSMIVDTAFVRGIKCYSVDTRCWKAKILGTSKPEFEPIFGVKDPQKFGSVRKAIALGFEENLRVYTGGKKGINLVPSVTMCEGMPDKVPDNIKSYNDDMADAICMSLYPFSGGPYNLKLEQ